MNSYDVGDKVKIEATFYLEVNGVEVPTDPGTVYLKIKKPSKQVLEYTYPPEGNIFRGSTGYYYREFVIDEPGTWWYRFEGVGTVDTAEDSKFRVRRSIVIS